MSKLFGTCKCGRRIDIKTVMEDAIIVCPCGIRIDYYFDPKLDKTVLEIVDGRG